MKLNGSRIARAIHEAGCTIAESDLAARLALVELSDIITEEGGPPNTLSLDDQLSGLLAAWKSMRAAGEEMPSEDTCVAAACDEPALSYRRAGVRATLAIVSPIVARLKQERDEARAELATTRANEPTANVPDDVLLSAAEYANAETSSAPQSSDIEFAHRAISVYESGHKWYDCVRAYVARWRKREAVHATHAEPDDSCFVVPTMGGYEDWRPSEGRFTQVIEDAQKKTDNDPRIMARALDQYLSEREQDWREKCQAAKDRKWFEVVPRDTSGFLMEPVWAARRAVDEAERREGDVALQLAEALARVKELEARLTSALVPLPKPERVEVGQRWAFVMTAGETAGSIAPYIRSWHMSDGICRFRVDIPSNMNCIKTSMRYLGDGNEQR